MRQGTDTWEHKLRSFALKNNSNTHLRYKPLSSPFKSDQPVLFRSLHAWGGKIHPALCTQFLRNSPRQFSLYCRRLFMQCVVRGMLLIGIYLGPSGTQEDLSLSRLLASLNSLSQYHLGSNWKDSLCLIKSRTQKQSSFLQILSVSTRLIQQGKFPAEICQITHLASFTFFFLTLFSRGQENMSSWSIAQRAPIFDWWPQMPPQK